ncbi:MAG TPA: HDOD domain-containing protein [Nitrospirae bacterium]|nr:HDOD domain-containing protein [Nitrospirota bacterium]
MNKNISRLKDLPTLPVILQRLFNVLQDEQSTFVDIANVIRHDQTLTEKILRVSNSPYFGHAGKVNTLEQAIMFLGYDLVKGICLGTSVFKLLGRGEREKLGKLWQHSYEVGIIAANISDHVCNIERGICFVSGLLHDIGRVIFLTLDRERYLSILSTDETIQKEREIFGTDHPAAGGSFLENALLPEEIVCAVRYHHTPSQCTRYRETSSIIALAEALSRSFFPKIEDDGAWSDEHDAIVLELSLDEGKMKDIRENSKEESSSMKELFTV